MLRGFIRFTVERWRNTNFNTSVMDYPRRVWYDEEKPNLALGGTIVNVISLLTPKAGVAYLYEDFTIRQGLEKLRHYGYTAIPVLARDGQYVGTVSEGDFLWCLLDEENNSLRAKEKLPLRHVLRPAFNPAVRVDVTLEELLDYLEGNLNFFRSWLKENLPMVKMMEPDASYLVWMDFRALNVDSVALHDLLLKQGKIWLEEGYIFGTAGNGFERFNLACPRARVEEGLERIKQGLEKAGLI